MQGRRDNARTPHGIPFHVWTASPNKRMQLTSLSAAPGELEAPPRAPAAGTNGRTGSQLIRSVRQLEVEST